MRYFIVIMVSLIFQVKSIAQIDSVTLIQCMVAARTQALIKPQIETYNEIAELQKSARMATNFPSLSAYGKAWYQSDAITVETPTGPYLEIDRFQYNFGVEANQKLYDGSIARKGKELDELSSSSLISKVETDLYHLNDQVVDFFFQTMLLRKNTEILKLKESILTKRLKELESAFSNGMISSAELSKIRAELLSTRQKIMEMEKISDQTRTAMQILTGIEIGANTKLNITDSISMYTIASRPEHRYFDTEMLKLDKLAGLNSAKYLPKLYAFGQTGYSYPGLDFFKNQSDYYYIVGAKLSWTIFDWNQNKRGTQVLRKQKEILSSKRNDFNQKIEMSANKEMIEQQKLAEMIELDNQIIEQRTFISNASASALQNGTITTASYLDDLNAEIIARLKLETHKIQYQNSLTRVYLLKGIDLEAYKINIE